MPEADTLSPHDLDPDKLAEFDARVHREQNFLRGLAAGAGAALIGAAAWILVTVITKFQIGFMAVGVGLLTGLAIRRYGNGVDPIFGLMGGALSLLGCLFGNFFSYLEFISRARHVGVGTLLANLPPAGIVNVIKAGFKPMDVLFSGIAIYSGYKYAFRVIKSEELEAMRRP